MSHTPEPADARAAARPGDPSPGEPRERESTLGRSVLRRVFRRGSTLCAAGFILVLLVCAVFAGLLAPFHPDETNYGAILEGPSIDHLLGTDQYGRDTLSRLIFGVRVTMAVSLGAVSLAILIGVSLGLLLGYRGGWWDRIGSRAMDVSDSLPGILVAFAVIAVLGRGLVNVVVAVALVFCMNLARMTRAVTLAEREKGYVDAAVVSGLRGPEIIFRQILPNLVVPLTAQASILLGTAIIIESTLSFLNIGVEAASWGGMLSSASSELTRTPFLAIPPGLAIVVSVLAFNVVANGISDVVGGTSVGVLSRPTPSSSVASTSTCSEEPALDRASFRPGSLLEVRGVTVEVARPDGSVPIVEDAWLSIGNGEVLGLLGESGSGKSMLARSILGLLPPPTYLAAGSVSLDGQEIAHRNERQFREFRGSQIAAVFQNPSTALSPVHTVGRQLTEPLRIHLGMSRSQAWKRAGELLDQVGVEDPHGRLHNYPHEFSGGMAQRVAIAMALAADPKVLIADEATSALDVTTQAQVLDLLMELRASLDMSILMITHDLGVVAETCDRAAVMYAGQIVEVAEVEALFDAPQHPYTSALLASNPSLDHSTVGRRPVIGGTGPRRPASGRQAATSPVVASTSKPLAPTSRFRS
jgi:ABC-type dipeptide/oligopeptide/nickel transport system ATPase component/ABC-type dipeptide/oligopeptide/nickel transport system permease subunit